MTFTLSKWGLGSSPGLPKLQSSIAGVKTPRLEAFFISLESYWSVDVENGLAWTIWTSVAQVMAKRRVENQNWQFDSQPLKVRNRPNPGVCRWSATHHWKALKENYKFASNLIQIRGLSEKLWTYKVPGVQTRTVSRLLLGSPGTNSHSNVGATEWRREYYMGEGGGFPWVRAVMSLMSPKLLVTCPSTKGVVECELTNFVSWFDAGSNK